MAPLTMGEIPSMRRQHLLSEFAGLKQACPDGVFVSLTPGDPSLWSGVIFVRDGPYAPAVLRFHLSFPESYPRVPPLITFSTDMFHPLITPSTTNRPRADLRDDETSGATDQERLPPGGFSLRHGFPEWYGCEENTAAEVRPEQRGRSLTPLSHNRPGRARTPVPAEEGMPGYMQTTKRAVSIYGILKYIRSTFDNNSVLDSVPLDAVANPGAWHAWRTHRRKQGIVIEDRPGVDRAQTQTSDGQQPQISGADAKKGGIHQAPVLRRPGEWNWNGVWEHRVKEAVAASLSESVLYGASGAPDDLIRFLAMQEGDVESIKDNVRRTLGGAL